MAIIFFDLRRKVSLLTSVDGFFARVCLSIVKGDPLVGSSSVEELSSFIKDFISCPATLSLFLLSREAMLSPKSLIVDLFRSS